MIRPTIQTQVLPGSLASASYTTGPIDDPSTVSIYCSVNGPLPVKPKLELEDRAAIKCIWRSSFSVLTCHPIDKQMDTFLTEMDIHDGVGEKTSETGSENGSRFDRMALSRPSREIEHILHGILSETLLTLLFPRSGFLFTFFLSKSGTNSSFHEILSCAINCLSVVLIDSGLFTF